MKQFTITHLLLLVTWCAIASIVLARFFANAPYQGDTHENAVRQSPAWHPADSNPPVSARSALSIAEQFRRARLRDKNNWKWGLESLTLYPLDGKNNKWCWCVLFTAYPEVGGLGGVPPQFSVYVLMNGNVVTPKSDAAEYLKEWGIMAGEEESARTVK
jgi:hypothetical protein